MRGSVLLWSCGGALHATYVRSDLGLRHVHQSIIFNVFLFSNLHDVDVVNFVYLHHLPLRLNQDFHYFPAVFLVCCELTKVREIAAFYSSSLNKDDTKTTAFMFQSVLDHKSCRSVSYFYSMNKSLHIFNYWQTRDYRRRHPTHAVCVRVSSLTGVTKAAKLENGRHIVYEV